MHAFVRQVEQRCKGATVTVEAVDGVNLVVSPASALPTPVLLQAARAYASHCFFHAAGLGPECRQPEVFLWRLLDSLRCRLDFADPVPADPAAMRDVLPNWLARAAAGGGLAIVLEGAHELSTDGLVADLDWLPGWLPPGVAVLLSAPPGPSAEQFRERSAAVFELSGDDAAPPSAGRLPDELLTTAANGRWLELLWAARAGMGRSALETLAGPESPAVDSETPGLLVSDRHIALASPQARDAVARRLLADHGRRQALHMELAEYYGGDAAPESLRLACWHWAAAGRVDRLEQTLTEPRYLEAMRQPSHAFEALRHWRVLGGSQRMSERLEETCRASDRSSAALLGAAHLFRVATAGDPPVSWLQRAAEEAETESDPGLRIASLQALATHPETGEQDARAMLERAVRLAERDDGCDAANRASLHHHLACLFESADRLDDAVREYRRGLEIVEADLGQDSPRLIAWLTNLATAHKASGDLAQADPLARRALRLARQHLGERHPTTASCCDQLAGIAYLNGQFDAAEPLYREALEITEAAFGPRHAATAACLGNLGNTLDALRKFDEAVKCHRRALAILTTTHGQRHEDTALCMHNLAVALESTGETAEAERLYRDALESWNEIAGDKSPAFATTLLNLAGVLRERGAWAESEALYRSDIEIWRELAGPDHPHTLGALTELGRLYLEGGKPEMAEPLLRHVEERIAQRAGRSDSSYLEVIALLARALQDLGEPADARELIENTLEASEGTLNMLSAPVQKLRKLLQALQDDPTRPGSIDA